MHALRSLTRCMGLVSGPAMLYLSTFVVVQSDKLATTMVN